MKAILQRVNWAEITIDGIEKRNINIGLVVLLGITHIDTAIEVNWLAKKIVNLRIFADKDNKMNLSLLDIAGDILLVSQFTLHAQTKKGNRPSFIAAARPEIAEPLYQKMIEELSFLTQKNIKTGTFGANMQINLVNDGPVTIIIDSKE